MLIFSLTSCSRNAFKVQESDFCSHNYAIKLISNTHLISVQLCVISLHYLGLCDDSSISILVRAQWMLLGILSSEMLFLSVRSTCTSLVRCSPLLLTTLKSTNKTVFIINFKLRRSCTSLDIFLLKTLSKWWCYIITGH